MGPYKAALPWTDANHPGHVRDPRQPRLVRRAHRLHARVRPGELDRRASDEAAPELFRDRTPAPALAVGNRHPERRLRRQRPDRVLPPRGEADAARRSADPVFGEAELDRRRRPGRLPQPRVRRAQARPRRCRHDPDDLRRQPSLRPLHEHRRRGARTSQGHGRRRRGIPVGDAHPARPRRRAEGDARRGRSTARARTLRSRRDVPVEALLAPAGVRGVPRRVAQSDVRDHSGDPQPVAVRRQHGRTATRRRCHRGRRSRLGVRRPADRSVPWSDLGLAGARRCGCCSRPSTR